MNLTVGYLRKLLNNVPDHAEVKVDNSGSYENLQEEKIVLFVRGPRKEKNSKAGGEDVNIQKVLAEQDMTNF